MLHEEAAHALVDEGVEDRVDERHDHGDDHRRDRSHDRDETATAEEAEVGRQLDPVIALIEQGGDDADDDSAEHSEVDDVLTLAVVRAEARRHGREDTGEDHIPDDRGQRGGAVGLLRESDGHTDGEDQRQVVEQSRTSGREDRRHRQQPTCELAESVCTEHVRLTEAHEQGRGRQDSDRKHERAADALELGESRYRLLAFLRCLSGWDGHRIPPRKWGSRSRVAVDL